MVTVPRRRRRVVVSRCRGRRLGRVFALRRKVLQVRQQPFAQRVAAVHAFHRLQVPGHFGRALSETDVVIVHRVLGRVVGQRVQTCKSEKNHDVKKKSLNFQQKKSTVFSTNSERAIFGHVDYQSAVNTIFCF